jgi:hypothetical protein
MPGRMVGGNIKLAAPGEKSGEPRETHPAQANGGRYRRVRGKAAPLW